MIKSGNMESKRLNRWIIVLAILMGLVSYALAWSVYREYQLVTSASLALAWAALVILLIRHVRRTNRELARFLLSLRFDDTSNLFDTEGTRGFRRELLESFNRVILAFRELKIKQKQEQSLFESTVEQTGAGILVLEPEGMVAICNQAFRDLLDVGSFSRLDQLEKIHPGAYAVIRSIRPGNQEILEFSVKDPRSFEPDDQRHLILNAREIIVKDRKLKVITVQNIRHEIEQREADAWEKLLRIYNHEIINTVSPINLLSASVIEMLQENGRGIPPGKLDPENIEKALMALNTIQKRGQGLVGFAEAYRALAKLPDPVLRDLKAGNFIAEIITLMKPELDAGKIRIECEIDPPDMILRADESLIQQAMINLVRNSMEALQDTDEPVIRISAALKDNRPVVSISDNGPGIPEDLMDKIFTPFYTTRKEGSGIGLSFARQVMKMHKGRISAGSPPDSGALFTLYF
jgi:nitrogen fixation/metabolism regulation signal transduction histidine kinase